MRNRESAQASRERKRNYVNDLEKTVTKLNINNKELNSQVSSLEEENQKLREQLIKATKGEKIEIPEQQPLKKQKLNIINNNNNDINNVQKLPLPPQNMNFFTSKLLVKFI